LNKVPTCLTEISDLERSQADVVEEGVILWVAADRLPVEGQCLLVLPRLEGLVALLTQHQRLGLLS
jgi:hypothetical protein